MRSVARILLHPRAPGERPWKYLLPVLALAFVARAAIALSGDFVLHPDEIMQYLEPAHRLVFGNGVIYWEFFYGARSWLVPGLVAGVLALCEAAGLGQPFWYVGGVKLLFCAVSLLVPAGMYWFARRHFGEPAARVALLAGAFWYELAGFAHKPMTEFVATALLVALLALCVRSSTDRPVAVWSVAALAVLVTAIRMHYAPAAAILLGLFFLRSGRKLPLVLAVAALVAAVGVFDAVTWNGGLFHSYGVNIAYNLVAGGSRAGESPPWQFLWWLVLAGAGLNLLLIGADLATRLTARLDARRQARSSPKADLKLPGALEQSFGVSVQQRTIAGEQFDVLIHDHEHILVAIAVSVGPTIKTRLERTRRVYEESTGTTPTPVILANPTHCSACRADGKSAFHHRPISASGFVHPALDGEVRDAGKLVDVAGDQRRPQRPGMSGDQKVVVADRATDPLQFGAYVAVVPIGRLLHREDVDTLQDRFELFRQAR